MVARAVPLLFCLGCRDLAALDTRVPVGNLSLHIVCQGKGAPSVVLDAGPKPPPFDEMPPAQLAEFERSIGQLEGLDLKTMRAGFAELEASNRSLGKKPLVILVAGKPQLEPFLDPSRARELFEARQQAQKSLTQLSTNSVLVKVRNSSHHIPMESPDAVVAAIRAVVDSARTGAVLREPVD